MRNRTEFESLAVAAATSAGAMIAFQVGGKATRDALFLSNFSVTALPGMLVMSACFSIAAVLATSRLLSTKGPGGVIPYAFGASSLLLVAEWFAFALWPRAVAVALYLHMAAFGAILISGFWSMLAELFDPRTARAQIGRITAGGTLGGLLGGVIAERTGAMASISSMLLVLAALHFICALLNRRLAAPVAAIHANGRRDGTNLGARSPFQILKEVRYVKYLAVLVLFGTVAETLLDYVLKTQATAAFSSGQELMRFFALFYTGISLLTFIVQAIFSRYSLQQFGLAGAMATMPFAVATGGLGALIWPGLFSIGLVRGAESILRSSLYRSGYELLYAPVPREEKRAAKTIVDVGFDRLGDALGGGIIRLVLSVGLAASLTNQVFTSIALVLGVASLLLTTRLGKGYVFELEKSLLNQAAELDLLDVEERTTRETMLRTLGNVDLRAVRSAQQPYANFNSTVLQTGDVNASMQPTLSLQDEDPDIVRRALRERAPIDSMLVAPTIQLLARDAVAEDAVAALAQVAPGIVGQLTDALLNVDEDFAIRRRIPRVMTYARSSRAVEGLMQGLADPRFEVRFSCGRALSKMTLEDPNLRPKAESVYAAALKEISFAARLAETPRVLDHYDDNTDSLASDALWNSTDIRLEHIFRLLSLSLPREPLHVAFQALHTDDAHLRGTALEYLESILPPGIRENLWQFLEGTARPTSPRNPSDQILHTLMQSRDQIELTLSIAGKSHSRRGNPPS